MVFWLSTEGNKKLPYEANELLGHGELTLNLCCSVGLLITYPILTNMWVGSPVYFERAHEYNAMHRTYIFKDSSSSFYEELKLQLKLSFVSTPGIQYFTTLNHNNYKDSIVPVFGKSAVIKYYNQYCCYRSSRPIMPENRVWITHLAMGFSSTLLNSL